MLAAKQQQGSADADAVARTQPANLDDVAIYSRAIGALKVSEDDLAVIELNLGVKAADALVVEAQHVAFFPANGHGGGHLAKDSSLVNTFKDRKCNKRHGPIS